MFIIRRNKRKLIIVTLFVKTNVYKINISQRYSFFANLKFTITLEIKNYKGNLS